MADEKISSLDRIGLNGENLYQKSLVLVTSPIPSTADYKSLACDLPTFKALNHVNDEITFFTSRVYESLKADDSVGKFDRVYQMIEPSKIPNSLLTSNVLYYLVNGVGFSNTRLKIFAETSNTATYQWEFLEFNRKVTLTINSSTNPSAPIPTTVEVLNSSSFNTENDIKINTLPAVPASGKDVSNKTLMMVATTKDGAVYNNKNVDAATFKGLYIVNEELQKLSDLVIDEIEYADYPGTITLDVSSIDISKLPLGVENKMYIQLVFGLNEICYLTIEPYSTQNTDFEWTMGSGYNMKGKIQFVNQNTSVTSVNLVLSTWNFISSRSDIKLESLRLLPDNGNDLNSDSLMFGAIKSGEDFNNRAISPATFKAKYVVLPELQFMTNSIFAKVESGTTGTSSIDISSISLANIPNSLQNGERYVAEIYVPYKTSFVKVLLNITSSGTNNFYSWYFGTNYNKIVTTTIVTGSTATTLWFNISQWDWINTKTDLNFNGLDYIPSTGAGLNVNSDIIVREYKDGNYTNKNCPLLTFKRSILNSTTYLKLLSIFDSDITQHIYNVNVPYGNSIIDSNIDCSEAPIADWNFKPDVANEFYLYNDNNINSPLFAHVFIRPKYTSTVISGYQYRIEGIGGRKDYFVEFYILNDRDPSDNYLDYKWGSLNYSSLNYLSNYSFNDFARGKFNYVGYSLSGKNFGSENDVWTPTTIELTQEVFPDPIPAKLTGDQRSVLVQIKNNASLVRVVRKRMVDSTKFYYYTSQFQLDSSNSNYICFYDDQGSILFGTTDNMNWDLSK